MQYFEGRTVLLTGATSGLGYSLLRIISLVRNCNIIIAGRSLKKLTSLVSDLGDVSAHISAAKLDLESSDSDIRESISVIYNIHGKIDVLLNCAGMGFRGKVVETVGDVDRRIMQVDYFGQIAVIKSLLQEWKQSGACAWDIVQVGSVQGFVGIADRAPYSAAKHALVGFLDCLRAELDEYPRPSARRVMLVAPGYIATNHSVNSITGSGSLYSEQDASTVSGYSPDYVARQILEGCAGGRRELIIADLKVKILLLIRSFFPALCFRILRNRFLVGTKQQHQAYIGGC